MPATATRAGGDVRFLDYADRRIRRYMYGKQKLIKLLEEQKQAVVHGAITQGVDRSARVKVSAVGQAEVPAHWEEALLGRCLRRIDQGWSPVAAEGDVAPNQWVVLTLSSVKRGSFNAAGVKPIPAHAIIPHGIEINDGDLLLTRSNTRELVGDVCIVAGVRPRTVVCDLIYRLVVEPTVFDRRFLMWQLLSPVGRRQVERDARGSSGTMPKIAQRHIRAWRVLVPPLEEQRQIVEAIEARARALASALERARAEVDLLREYRTRLVSDVVTGRLDVREVAASLPSREEDAEAQELAADRGDIGDAIGEGDEQPAIGEAEA